MPNRIIKESINESKGLSEVSFFAEDLYKRLITYADDYGRFNADYQIMRARLYPREIQIVSEGDIEDALIELSGAGKISFYTSTPRKEIYGCFPNWSEHQRVRESRNKCPDPDDTYVNDYYYRRFIPISMKKEIIERDNFKCQICGKYITTLTDSSVLVKKAAGLFHIDHIVPVSQGGRATMENLRLTCPKCNLERKRILSVEDILELSLKEKEIKIDGSSESCGESQKVAANCCPNPIQSKSESKSESKSYTGDARLDEAIEEFKKHRKNLKKPMTDRAVQLMVGKLKDLGQTVDEQIAIINQSIENGWQGVFPLKESHVFETRKKEKATNDFDEWRKLYEEAGE